MIIALKIVPKPGFCFKGIHNSKILALMMKVANPTVIFVMFATPSAKTVQGVTPKSDIINKASPKPKKNNPIIRKKNVLKFGLKLNGEQELQDTFGICVILKIFKKLPYST